MSSAATATPLRPRPTGSVAPDERGHQHPLEALPPVPERIARPRTFYAVVTVATVIAIVVAQLLLSIAVSQGAYRIGALKNTKNAQQQDLQAATESLDRLSSPQNLAANAHALGMVSTGTPVFLRLSDNAVLGSPAAAAATGDAAGNQVPNHLLTSVPLASGHARTGVNAPPKTSSKVLGAPGGNAASTPTGPVPLKGALPSPKTH